MKTIELWDIRDHVFLNLKEVLDPLLERARRSMWDVSGFADEGGLFEVASIDGHDELSLLADTRQRILGSRLLEIAAATPQVIWATFRGFDPGDGTEPWIRLHAIDSTYWRCESRDIAARKALMTAFQDVRLKG